MQTIASSDSVDCVKWLEIELLIRIRWLQNKLNESAGVIISSFIVVEEGDSVDSVEQAICNCLRDIPTADGGSIDEVFAPSFDWVVTHVSCHEVAFVHCDREYGVCLLIPRDRSIDPDLLALGECSEVSVPEVVAMDVVYQSAQ